MTIIDILILVGLVLATVLGYRDGLFRKILGIASFFIGLIAATKFMGPLGRVFAHTFNFSIEISYVLAFFMVFMAVIVLQKIIYRIVGEMSGGLKVINRLGGAILGIFQGSLSISLLLLMLSIFEIPSESTRNKSSLYKPFLNIAPRVFDLTSTFLPESKTFYDELKKDLEKYKIF